jgi:hypothetical protein
MDPDLKFIHQIISDTKITNGFPLVYKGKLSHDIMKMFTAMAENKVARASSSNALKKRLFHVMVELLQNITKHSDDYEEDGVGNGIFVVGERNDAYYVITGNIIKTENVEKLESHIQTINTRSKEELDEMHKTQMRDGELSKKGTAGLGLIDMVRKTGEKLIYEFQDIDKGQKFFIVKVTLDK